MGLSHSMNEDQVDEFVGCVMETTAAVRGLEQKAAKFDEYILDAKRQRDKSISYTETLSVLLDRLSQTLVHKSDEVWLFCNSSLETLADVVEQMEAAVGKWGIHHASSELKKELGPLLVPAMVLVTIITISNSYFGFILAGDDAVSATFTFHSISDSDIAGEETVKEAFNILNLFAVFHVVLIGLCVVYVTYEALRKNRQTTRQQSRHDGDSEEASENEHNHAVENRGIRIRRSLAQQRRNKASLFDPLNEHLEPSGPASIQDKNGPDESPRAIDPLDPSKKWSCPALDLNEIVQDHSPSSPLRASPVSSSTKDAELPFDMNSCGSSTSSPFKRRSEPLSSSPLKSGDIAGPSPGGRSTTPVSALLRGMQQQGTDLMRRKQRFMSSSNTGCIGGSSDVSVVSRFGGLAPSSSHEHVFSHGSSLEATPKGNMTHL